MHKNKRWNKLTVRHLQVWTSAELLERLTGSCWALSLNFVTVVRTKRHGEKIQNKNCWTVSVEQKVGSSWRWFEVNTPNPPNTDRSYLMEKASSAGSRDSLIASSTQTALVAKQEPRLLFELLQRLPVEGLPEVLIRLHRQSTCTQGAGGTTLLKSRYHGFYRSSRTLHRTIQKVELQPRVRSLPHMF